MRFGISRSPSPSPIRRGNTRGRPGYGLGVYDSSDGDEELGQEFLEDDSSSSSSSPFYVSESKVPLHNSSRMTRSAQAQREIDETVLSLRRHGEYEEPFKTWAKETRTAAFRAASTRYENNPGSIAAARKREIELRKKRVKETYDRQYEEVTAILEQMNIRRKQQEMKLIADYKERERLLWQRVEGVIKDEEDKLRKKLEAEEIAKQEMEERRRREEERRKAEEEKQKKEEQEKALREELLRKKKKKEEEEARQNMEEEKRKRTEMDRMRNDAGFSTAQDDWESACQSLKLVKKGHVPSIKRDPDLRSIWSKGRRAIVPKIGQLTNSQSEIQRITNAILQVFPVQPPYPEPLYFSLLSALAKAILMQAETEVSARAVTAVPLAQVTVRLLTGLEQFADVLFARMVQRTGGWAIPIPVAKSPEITEIEYKKLRGYRTEREEQKDFENRVQGVMTLYFAILTADVPQPIARMWAFPRYWTYLARLMSTPILLRSEIAMQILAIALAVGGARAKRAWGIQFLKLLGLLYRSLQETPDGGALDSQNMAAELAGASGAEGRPARVKVILEIEKVMST